jgi:hypothetical protein
LLVHASAWIGIRTSHLSETIAKSLGQRLQCLWQDSRISKDRHEVGISIPARDNVKVEVLPDARTGHLTEVEPDVEPLSLHDFPEHGNASLAQAHQVHHFLMIEGFQFGCLPVGHDHKVPTIVWITIHDHVASLVPMHDQICHVIIGLPDAREHGLLSR